MNDKLWEEYEKGGSKNLSEKKEKEYLKSFGIFNFLPSYFLIEDNEILLKSELDANNLTINGIDYKGTKVCKKCGQKAMFGTPVQYRSADEGLGMKYECFNCGNIEMEK